MLVCVCCCVCTVVFASFCAPACQKAAPRLSRFLVVQNLRRICRELGETLSDDELRVRFLICLAWRVFYCTRLALNAWPLDPGDD
jgi:hypothetical protein